MNNLRHTLLFVGFISLTGILVQGQRMISREKSETASLRREKELLKPQLAAQLRANEATAHELVLAQGELATLTDPSDPTLSDSERARKREISSWIAHVKRLKKVFEQHPEQSIPEMRLVTDDDWLRTSKQLDLESDDGVRKACAAMRTAAKQRFATSLAKAVQKVFELSKGEAPSTLQTIARYIADPTETDFLSEVELVVNTDAAEPAMHGVASWEVREKVPVDPDYDCRYIINGNGGWAMVPAPQAWIPDFQQRSKRAYQDFSAANNGATPSSFSQLAPYFNPPLDPKIVEKIDRVQRD